MLFRFFRLYVALILSAAFGVANSSEVVLYSSNDVETVNRVVELFNKENPNIKVSVVRAGTGALMQRIKAEASNPLGDIFWSGGISTIDAFRDHFESYQSSQANSVAPQYRSQNNLWLGTNTHVTVLMVNLRQVPGNQAPRNWIDLADPKWKGKIVITDPERSSASYVALYGLQKLLGKQKLAQIARNATIVGTTSAAYEGVAKGEFSVAITMEYAAYAYMAGGLKEIKLVYPDEGTFLSPEGMALIKGAKHPAEARKLYEFLASKHAQTEIFKVAYRRPLRPDIEIRNFSDLPELRSLKIVPLSDEQMVVERAEFLAQWREMISSR